MSSESDQITGDLLEHVMAKLRQKQHALETQLTAQEAALEGAQHALSVLELGLSVAALDDDRVLRLLRLHGDDPVGGADELAVFRMEAMRASVEQAVEYLKEVKP